MRVSGQSVSSQESQATAPARAAGYAVDGFGDLACDQGSAAALGLDPDGSYYGAALHFASEDDARQAAAVIGDVAKVARVVTYCLD